MELPPPNQPLCHTMCVIPVYFIRRWNYLAPSNHAAVAAAATFCVASSSLYRSAYSFDGHHQGERIYRLTRAKWGARPCVCVCCLLPQYLPRKHTAPVWQCAMFWCLIARECARGCVLLTREAKKGVRTNLIRVASIKGRVWHFFSSVSKTGKRWRLK